MILSRFSGKGKASARRKRTRDTRDEGRRLLPSGVYSPPKFQLFDTAVQFTLKLVCKPNLYVTSYTLAGAYSVAQFTSVEARDDKNLFELLIGR